MNHRFAPSAFALGLVLSMVACQHLTEPPAKSNEVGFVVLNARSKPGGGYTTSPVANFYNVLQPQLSSAATAWDSCRVVAYDPTVGNAMVAGPLASVLGAGSFMLATVSGRTDSLKPPSPIGDGTYRLAATSGMPFTPGDSIRLTVPGATNGFPASALTGKTAEAFTFDPIVTPLAGQGLALNWTRASDNNSAMIFSFAYSNAGTSSLNEQLYCAYADDGSAFVPPPLWLKYILSPVKKVTIQRLRTAIVSVPVTGIGAVLNLISTFDWPMPASP